MTKVQFMVRAKLPPAPEGLCDPHNDVSDHWDYKDAVFAAKPAGFEIHWPYEAPWPVDAEGYTFIPLYLSDEVRASEHDNRLAWVNKYLKLDEKHRELKAKLKELAERT